MRSPFAALPASLIGLFIASSSLVHADGLSDLKAALGRLQGQTPIKAIVDAKTWSKNGEGKDAEERSGAASVQIEEGANGLRLQFSRDTLTKLDTEERAKEKDSKAKTPISSALSALSTSELREMTSAAANMQRDLDKANFKAERAETWNGKPARLLSFELDMDKNVKEKDRKYIKKFEGTAEVWIAADGTPLASRMQVTASGRAFVVISFESSNSEDQVFGVVGDRLVVLRKDSQNKGSGAGEKGEGRTTRTLQLQS